MAKYLRYFRVHEDEELGRKLVKAHFRNVNFIFDLFELEFGKTPSKGVSCLQIWFTEEPGRHLKAGHLFEGILEVYVYFDFGLVTKYDLPHQKKFFLDGIYQAYMAHATEYGWDREHCDKVYRRILDDGIVFDRMWGKAIRNRATRDSVQVHVHYFDTVDLSFVVWDKTGTVIRKKLIARLPGTLGALEAAHGTLFWQDKTRVRLTFENNRDYWEYEVESDDLQFHYPRAERGDAHGQYDLGMMYLNGEIVHVDRAKALHWLRQSAAQGFGRAVHMLEKLHQEDKQLGGTP